MFGKSLSMAPRCPSGLPSKNNAARVYDMTSAGFVALSLSNSSLFVSSLHALSHMDNLRVIQNHANERVSAHSLWMQ